MASGCETDRSGHFGSDAPAGGAVQVRVTLFQPLQWDAVGIPGAPLRGSSRNFR